MKIVSHRGDVAAMHAPTSCVTTAIDCMYLFAYRTGEEGAAAANELCNVMGPGGRTSTWAPVLALSHMCVRSEARHAVSKRLPDVADRARIVRRSAQARMPQQPWHGAPGHVVKVRRDSIVGSSLEALAGLDSNQIGFGLTVEWTQEESGAESGGRRGGVSVHGGGKGGEREDWFSQLCKAIGTGRFELEDKEGYDLLLGCLVALSLLYHDCPPTLVSPLVPATAWSSLLEVGSLPASALHTRLHVAISREVVKGTTDLLGVERSQPFACLI